MKLITLIVAMLMTVVVRAAPVTIDTVAYQINLGTRNTFTFSRIGTIALGAECVLVQTPLLQAHVLKDRLKVKLDAGRTSWPNQAFVTCGAAPPPPPPPPPATTTQVYSCADAGADGRALESATLMWPNCATASYQNPSKTLVVASNMDGVLRWLLASKTTGRVWARTGTVEAWVRVEDISWGTTTTPPAPGVANLRWTASPTPSVTGYRLLYGTAPDLLVRSVDVIPPEPRTLKIEGLAPGPYYFRMQAYDEKGVHGPLSDLLVVPIQ